MDFLKRLLGTGSQNNDPDGLYFYVRATRTGEVIQVRVHRHNDLSQTDDGAGFFTRKTIVGQRGFDRVNAEFFFDRNRRLTTSEIEGGELVTSDDYEAFLAEQAAKNQD